MRALYFIVAATILAEVASSTNSTINCCVGNNADDSSYVCNATQHCGEDDFLCGTLNLQFDDQNIVSRGCYLSEVCSNATELYEQLQTLLPSIYNDTGISNSSLPSYLEIKCCDAEKCNGVTLMNETASSIYNATDNVTNDETNNGTNNVTNDETNNMTNNATNNETTANDTSVELSCCSGTAVGDSTTPTSCDTKTLCGRNDDKCSTVEVQFGDQTAVFQGCLPSASCQNVTEAYESAKENFLTEELGLNASQARPEDVVCCGTANCNGVGFVKGESFNVCFVIFLVLSYFYF